MRKFTFNNNQATAQTEFVSAASQNPRKSYFTTTYRDDLLRFSNPVKTSPVTSENSIPFTYQPYSTTQVLVAGYDTSYRLRVGTKSYNLAGASFASEPVVSATATGCGSTLRGSWFKSSGTWLYYFMDYNYKDQVAPVLYSVNSSGGSKTPIDNVSGLPETQSYPAESVFTNVVRPAAFIYMEHGDKIVVYTSYKQISAINQLVCTMNFYHAEPDSVSFRKLRTTIQYEIPYKDTTRTSGIIQTFDPTAARVFGMSTAAGKFFIVANDGTKAVRFMYNAGMEGMAEPIIPIDIDANKLQILDAFGKKSYGKYHQFMPSALTKMGDMYYLNGQMIRTYSNGDRNVLEMYLSSSDGINWSVGDVSSFIDSAYYKKSDSQRLYNYALMLPTGGTTVYAMGNDCFTSSEARAIDKNSAETDFSEIVISGTISSNTNSSDRIDVTVMKGFSSIDPAILGGKTISLEAGYYNSSGVKKGLKIGEYFVESEMHVLSNVGKGPNKVTATDAGSWKLTRWSSITDIDRWSSTWIKDDLKALSKIIVKGISDGYKAVDNNTGTGLYLENLNDPFIGYTSTRDERDGMFTLCARAADTGNNTRLTSIALLFGAEDYTDIYTKGNADRKGFNAYTIPFASDWTGHVHSTEMRVSNLKRRADDLSTPENESDVDRAFQWTRRYTNFWAREVYTSGTDSSYNRITAYPATGSENIIYDANFIAEYDTDYEFVLRKQSGRIQLYVRKKGFTESNISDSDYTEYVLIHEYQFGKENRIDWGPRPYWGFAANTDVFASLEGWNSREYGDIETTLTDASENISNFQDFPDSEIASFGTQYYTSGSGHYELKVDPADKTKFISVWVDLYNVQGNYYIIEQCAISGKTIEVGEIVRCFIFTDLGGAVNVVNCTFNPFIREISPGVPANANVLGRGEFFGIISNIENLENNTRKIYFSRVWGGGFTSPTSNETYRYAIYKSGEKDYYASASSGSVSIDVIASTDGTSLTSTEIIPVDIKTGAVKQSEITSGRAAFVNRQNDAISIRFVESDGSTHYLHSGSWNGTKTGWDYPTNPVSDSVPPYVGLNGSPSTRDWRLLMHQGRLFPFSATQLGLPSGISSKAYMIKGDEIVRYQDETFYKMGRKTLKTWCVIPAYYIPIFPSQKGSLTVQQWSKQNSASWIEPGDKFNEIPLLSGMRLFINGKNGFSSVSGEVKNYAVSATGSNGSNTASRLTFTPALDSGVVSMNVDTERTKSPEKQLKEIAILSGRSQLDSDILSLDYTEPLCFYPVGNSATKKPDYFIKAHYWNMNAGLYNSVKDNLKYVCNLAGVKDVRFMDQTGTVNDDSTKEITDYGNNNKINQSNFVLEMIGSVTNASYIGITFRSAYKLEINIDSFGVVTLTLSTIPGFEPAKNITGNLSGSLSKIIAKVSVKLSDISITGSHFFRVIVRKERVIIEMDYMPVWSFDLKSYKFGGSKNDTYDLFTDAAGPIIVQVADISGGLQYTNVELCEEVENQIIDMSQAGEEAVQFITKERHIHTRSTQDGGIQFGRFLDGNRESSAVSLPTADFIKDQLEYNPFQVPGHVLVTGAEYGEHVDSEWMRQNGYKFSTNQNRLLDTVEDSIREAKLLIRMTKEDSDNSEIEMVGLMHLQPEDGFNKVYSYPEEVSEEQIVSAHNMSFDQSSIKSQFQVRKKYSMG